MSDRMVLELTLRSPNTTGPLIYVPTRQITAVETFYDSMRADGFRHCAVVHLVGGEKIAVCEKAEWISERIG